ncbi:MAG: hypothetical protein C4527_25825 [Candidatus Omnitrophota bacterium]|nr:MAG: hypothetical protein C4527_25825 [Candidatus Omnitrophota bacterium]
MQYAGSTFASVMKFGFLFSPFSPESETRNSLQKITQKRSREFIFPCSFAIVLETEKENRPK